MIVVDASVAALWFLPQALSDRAGELLSSDEELVGPPLLRLEVGSALLRAVRRKEISPDEAHRAMVGMLPAAVRLTSGAEDSEEPFLIAEEFGGSIYDAVYVALARRLQAPLSTNDRELAKVAQSAGVEVRRLDGKPD
jgi:predicted nucleic acid-binding protein